MKAWVYRRYGPPENLTFEEIETPHSPRTRSRFESGRAHSTRPTGTSCSLIHFSPGSPSEFADRVIR